MVSLHWFHSIICIFKTFKDKSPHSAKQPVRERASALQKCARALRSFSCNEKLELSGPTSNFSLILLKIWHEFWNCSSDNESMFKKCFKMKMSHIRRWLIAIVVLCILSVQALPRKKSLKKNLSAEQSDLIPIPDHLLDDYKISGKHKIFMTFINILKNGIRVKRQKLTWNHRWFYPKIFHSRFEF